MNIADQTALFRAGSDVLAVTFQVRGFSGRWRFETRSIHDGVVTDGAGRRMDLGTGWRERVHDLRPVESLPPPFVESKGGAIGIIARV